MSVHVLPSSDLAHRHPWTVTLSSSSDRPAPSGRDTCGCSLSMLAVPGSSTSVTRTATSWTPPEASIVTLYTFLSASCPPPTADCGFS